MAASGLFQQVQRFCYEEVREAEIWWPPAGIAPQEGLLRLCREGKNAEIMASTREKA